MRHPISEAVASREDGSTRRWTGWGRRVKVCKPKRTKLHLSKGGFCFKMSRFYCNSFYVSYLNPSSAIRFRWGVLFLLSGMLASKSAQPISSASMMIKFGFLLYLLTSAAFLEMWRSRKHIIIIPKRRTEVSPSAILVNRNSAMSCKIENLPLIYVNSKIICLIYKPRTPIN